MVVSAVVELAAAVMVLGLLGVVVALAFESAGWQVTEADGGTPVDVSVAYHTTPACPLILASLRVPMVQPNRAISRSLTGTHGRRFGLPFG